MQDASFITSDLGHAKKDRPRGDEAKTWLRKNGAWAKKGAKSYFGYKLHGAMDEEYVRFDELRLCLPIFTMARLVWQTKLKFGMLIKDISEQIQRDMPPL